MSINETEERRRLQTIVDNLTADLTAVRRQIADIRERQKIASPAEAEARAKLAETEM